MTLVVTILYVINSLYNTFRLGQISGAAAAVGNFIGLLIAVAIVGYQLWVVYAFMDEIKSGSVPQGQAGYVHAKQNEDA